VINVKDAYYKHGGLTQLIYSDDWKDFTIPDMYALLNADNMGSWTPLGESFILNAIKARKNSLLKEWTEE
jgi:hypothetical protein